MQENVFYNIFPKSYENSRVSIGFYHLWKIIIKELSILRFITCVFGLLDCWFHAIGLRTTLDYVLQHKAYFLVLILSLKSGLIGLPLNSHWTRLEVIIEDPPPPDFSLHFNFNVWSSVTLVVSGSGVKEGRPVGRKKDRCRSSGWLRLF